MIVRLLSALFSTAHHSGTGTLDAFFAAILLVVSVGLSLAMGVAASYLLVRVILGAFRSRANMPVAERARAAAAGD